MGSKTTNVLREQAGSLGVFADAGVTGTSEIEVCQGGTSLGHVTAVTARTKRFEQGLKRIATDWVTPRVRHVTTSRTTGTLYLRYTPRVARHDEWEVDTS